MIAKYLSTQQRLQLIYTIAKSEIESLELDESLWKSLCQEVDEICNKEEVCFEDRDHFLCCLFIMTASKFSKQSEITLLISNLMTRAGGHLSKQLHEISISEDSSEIEVSITDDTQL